MVHKRSRMIMLVLVLVMIFIMQSAKVTAKTDSLLYEGKEYSIELKFTDKANISENAILNVTEFFEGSKEYQNYYSQTTEFVKRNSDNQIAHIRFFDIQIMEENIETEPDDTVEVSIKCNEGIEKENELAIVHFIDHEKKELIEVKDEVITEDKISEISFDQESFSVIGMIIFDGIDSSTKDVGSEKIKETLSIDIEKEWSDGNEEHLKDAVTISLFEIASEKWEKCDELVLNHSNEWRGKFENLDRSKEYGIKETNIRSDDSEKNVTYQSTIEDLSERKWCQKERNTLSDGDHIALLFGEDKKSLLRKSSNTTDLNLRAKEITVISDEEYGDYCMNAIAGYEIWESRWNEEHKKWELYNEHSDVYLSLTYNSEKDTYVWVTSKEKTEGSYLEFEDGMISASVNGVTKYLGNITATGPYVGADKGSEAIARFEIFRYQIYRSGIYKIVNIKNETVEETKIQADVFTGKSIDYLGDKGENPDTDVDEKETSEKILHDLYRLYLSLEMQTDVTGLDLLMVIDVSSSMKANEDCKDTQGNSILRSEALRQALNQFVPSLLQENSKNRLSIVAFENQSIILQEWTNNSDEVLKKVNHEVDGEMPLYNGEGTNYEAALARAYEALTKRGYSSNAKAMIFLSDGEPTVYIEGNDDIEAGNVTVNIGETNLSDAGIEGVLPGNMKNIWCSTIDEEVKTATNEAIESFKKHNPGLMVGTIAFNTKITDHLKNLSSDSEFVTQIENGTPNDLIQAMELITEFVPKEICVEDELSEYVELYEEEPDIKVVAKDHEKETILFSSDSGMTEEGRNILDNEKPLEIEESMIRMNFQRDYPAENNYVYILSFNIKTSQRAYDQYADFKGIYPDSGDKQTDYIGNETSSEKKGFYSNGNHTKARYLMNGAVIEKKYQKPVVQADDGKLVIKKTDLDGKSISTGAGFVLYNAEDDEKVAEGITNDKGELEFEHLRLSVFDTGYLYYLVETKEPEGYIKSEKEIPITLFSDHVEIEEDNSWAYVDDEGRLVVYNAEKIEPMNLPVTGGGGTFGIYIIGMILITGGILMLKNRKISKLIMMFMTLVMGVHMVSATAFAIDKTDRGSITVNGVEEYASVSAYRLMDVNFDYDVQQPKNPMYMWTDEVAGWMSVQYPDYIDKENKNAVNKAFSEAGEGVIAQLYDKLAVAIKDGTVSASAIKVQSEGENVVINNLEMGNYFLLIEGGLKVYRPLTANVIPEWKDDVWEMSCPTVSAKASEPSITKEIAGGIKEENINIRDKVSFVLSAVIPSYPEHAKAKMFVVSDQLSEGLTLVDDSLKVYGMNSGKNDELLTTGFVKGAERTVDVEDKQVSFALDFDYESISGYESLKITYDAILNENAVIGEIGNGNVALLDYSNNPYIAGNYNTDGDETTVFTYGIKISKVDENGENGLSGAEFILSKDGQDILFSGENGVYHVAASVESGNTIVSVDENGFLTLNGLDAGTYDLTEVKAPDGYVKLQNPIEIVIADQDVNGKIETGDQEIADGYLPVTVKNDKGFTLPVTGGMGTTLFHIAGAVLMGSGILLIAVHTRKRRNSR